jgi:superfamily II DNA or RNA helicase
MRAWRLTGDEYISLEQQLEGNPAFIVDPRHLGISVCLVADTASGKSSRPTGTTTSAARPIPATALASQNRLPLVRPTSIKDSSPEDDEITRIATVLDSEEGLRARAPLWHQAAARRLEEILTSAALSRLVGPLEKVVRQMRRLQTSVDRPSSKRELAYALLVMHGEDLLAVSPVRSAIAQATKVASPKRWHPGKVAALEFVRRTMLPPELAGTPGESKPESFEYLEGPPQLGSLAPYQVELRNRMLSVTRRPRGRAVLTLPTGAGKTRVAVDAIREMFRAHTGASSSTNSSIVWLAHTEELCEQACQSFIDVWRSSSDAVPLHLIRFWGDHAKTADAAREMRERLSSGNTVLVSSPRRFLRAVDGSRSNLPASALLETTGLIIIDEAHRAAAPTYRLILEAVEKEAPDVCVVGLTATPFRKEYDQKQPDAGVAELRRLFRELLEASETLGTNPRQRLQRDGVLAQPETKTIKTHRRVSVADFPWPEPPTEQDADAIDLYLSREADEPNRRRVVLQELLSIVRNAPSSSILYFGPSVADAQAIAYCLREASCSAAFVSGNTRDATRRRLISDFRSGRVQVLTNCEVLTTGFDAPRVSHVVIARPTVSQVLYEQMVGRGLRGPKFGGTNKCQIIDFEDDYKGVRPTLGYEKFRRLWFHPIEARS